MMTTSCKPLRQLAVVLTALLAIVGPAWADDSKAPPKKEEPAKKPPANIDEYRAEIDKLRKEMQKEIERHREEIRKLVEEMRKTPFPAPPLPPVVQPFPGGRFSRVDDGRLGVRVDRPSEALAEQLDLPKGKGLVIAEVRPDSAAAKAGLKVHDILVEIGGKAVPSDVREFVSQVREIKAGTPVDVVVKRKGKTETVKGLSLPEARPGPAPRRPNG